MDSLIFDLSKINIPIEKKEKKMPGRPRKVPPKRPDPKTGAITSPSIDDALFDMFYCNPIAFKKALGFYLSLSDMPLDCTFTPNSITFLAPARYEKSKIQITIDITKLNHYYCQPGAIAKFGLSNQYIELHAKTIDSEHANLKWYSINGKTDETYIDYYAPKYKELHHKTLVCCGRYQQIDDSGFDDSDYQIRWQWDAKWFQKKLANCKIYGDQLTIKQIGGEYPLMFFYSNANEHAKDEIRCDGKDEMNFSSTIKPGEIFSISVQIKYWYPVASSAMIGSTVQISLHKDKPIITKIMLDDGAICIKVSTPINDIRQNNSADATASTQSLRTPSAEVKTANINTDEIKFSPFDHNSRPSSPQGSHFGSPMSSRPPSRPSSRPSSPRPSRPSSPQIPQLQITPLQMPQLKMPSSKPPSRPSSPREPQMSPRDPQISPSRKPLLMKKRNEPVSPRIITPVNERNLRKHDELPE